MNHMEFSLGVDRLKDCFGDRAYSNERVKIMFRMVQQESAAWWIRTVDQLIATNRQPPLMNEISELLSQEREKRWANEKREHAETARDWVDILPASEQSLLFEAIRKRMSGGVSDQDWACVLKLIQNIPEFPRGST